MKKSFATVGDDVMVPFGDREFPLRVVEVQPDDAGGVVVAAAAAAASTDAESAGAAAAGFGAVLRTGRGRVRRAFGRASGAGTDVEVTSAVNSGRASPRGGSVQLAAVPLRRAAARRRSDRGVSTTTLQTLRSASASGDTGDRRTSGAGGGSTGF